MDLLTFIPHKRNSAMSKKVRFSQLVKASGKPQTVILWTRPRKNSSFTKAVKQNRVLTVVRGHKNAKDFGLLGFHEQPLASYFIFPEPLPLDSDVRVVGIKYDLIRETEATSTAPAKAKAVKSHPKFKIVVERIASIELTMVLSALTKDEAMKKALEAAEADPFDTDHAKIQNRIKSANQQ
jgi:hypothetical protein